MERDGDRIELPPREAELLAWFVTHPVRPASRQELLREVWGYRGAARTRVVDMTVRRLREKIEPRPDRPIHLLTVRGLGYRFEPRTPSGPEAGAPPPERDRFFGRERELATLLDQLADGARRLTLLGPPGVGKSRLAIRAGRIWCDRAAPPGGVRLVDCTDCGDLQDLLGALSEALPEALGDRPAEALAAGAALAERGETLVILDNVDRATGSAAALIDRWAGLRELRVLATSREPLGLAGERCLSLGGLPPDRAAALFLSRAAALCPGLGTDPSDRGAAAAIGELLDGLPLAIELAAAQTVVLSPGELRERLRRGLLALRSDRRGRPDRHASLRGAIATSWELLDPWEREAMAQLSVFTGAFSLDAAEAVLALRGASEPPATWEVFKGLARRSMLTAEREGPRWRFRLLRPLRAFAAEHLDAEGRRDAETRHGSFYTRLRGGEALADLGEVLTATERALQRGDAALATAGCRALDSLGLPEDHPHRGDRWRLQVSWDRVRGALDRASETAERAAAEARAAGEPGPVAQALMDLGWVAGLRGDLRRSAALLEEAEGLARRAGDRLLRARICCRLGMSQLELGRRDLARESLAIARRDVRAEGDPPRDLAYCLNSAGYLDLVEGRLAAAAERYRRSAAISASLGDRLAVAWAVNNLGEAQRFSGDLDGAEASYRAAERHFLEARSGDVFVARYNLELTRLGRGQYAEARPALEDLLRQAERQSRRARVAVMHTALLPCAASAGDAEGFDRHLAAAERLLAETGFRDADTDWLLGLAAELAAGAGWPLRARRVEDLLPADPAVL